MAARMGRLVADGAFVGAAVNAALGAMLECSWAETRVSSRTRWRRRQDAPE
jgi:hypothetical protein